MSRRLADWLEGRLDPEAEADVAAAVAAGDARTRSTVDWLRSFLEVTRDFRLHQPPPVVRQSLRQHFARWSQARAVLERAPLVYAAGPVFDSRTDLALAGARSAGPDDEIVHLAYATDAADLVLDAQPLQSGLLRLEGQVLTSASEPAPIFQAVLRGEHFEQRTVDGDALGRFSFEDVPAGRYELRATNGELAIVADVDLRERAPCPRR